VSTYYTKCGREFSKSTVADTTGYHLPDPLSLVDPECQDCPFIIDVKEGYPVAVHKRFECRAGSKPPNQEDTYRGSAKDKTTLQVHSLHHDFNEAVIAFCREHPELSASYNQDCFDCRRSVSVSCSQNKKGMEAKQELINKFFPAITSTPDPTDDPDDYECDDCGYCDNAKLLCTADDKPKKIRISDPCCANFIPGGSRAYEWETDDTDDEDLEDELEGLDLEDQLDVLLKAGDAQDMKTNEEHSKYRCGECSLGHWYSGTNKYINVAQPSGKDVKRPCDPFTHYCSDSVSPQRKIADDEDFNPDTAPDWCQRKLEDQAKEITSTPTKLVTAEIPAVIPVSLPESFDYDNLDVQTRDTLKMAESEITKIKMQTVYDIGSYLKIAHEALAKAGSGSFGAWAESIGFSRSSALNYLQAYEFICTNFAQIEDAANIQPSLLFAASKPSAPAALAQAVIDGDITQHKDYQEALKKLKEAEDNARHWRGCLDSQKEINGDIRKLMVADAIENKNLISRLKAQEDALVEAKKNADPKKIDSLTKTIADLQKQLRDKPIEAPAVEIREVIPEGIALSWAATIQMAIYQIAELSDNELIRAMQRLGLNNYAVLKGDFRHNTLRASERLKKLNDMIIEAPVPAAEFVRWATELKEDSK
jgi:hypothetical protein